MKNLFKKIWNDPVWSKVIAAGIIAILSILIVMMKDSFKNNNKSEKESNTLTKSPEQEKDSQLKDYSKEIFIISQVEYLTGNFDPSKNNQFVKVNQKYCSVENDVWLYKYTYDAFKVMHEAAKNDGVNLKIISGTKNFSDVKTIWEKSWQEDEIYYGESHVKMARRLLNFYSMPGVSRQHWGTEIGLNQSNNHYFSKDQGLKTYQWLTQNAIKYGFCQPYNIKGENRPYGINERKWHWSYLPLSKHLTERLEVKVNDKMFVDFIGSETADEIGVVRRYALSINKDCQ